MNKKVIIAGVVGVGLGALAVMFSQQSEEQPEPSALPPIQKVDDTSIKPVNATPAPGPAQTDVAPRPDPANFQHGLIGAVYTTKLGPTDTPTLLWEYPIDQANWHYMKFADFGPTIGLMSSFPNSFSGAIDIPEAGQWGIRLRIERDPKSDGKISCQLNLKVEGATVINSRLESQSKWAKDEIAAKAFLSLPEKGLYLIQGEVACDNKTVGVVFESQQPGHSIWEPAQVRRPNRKINVASTPDTKGGVQVLSQGVEPAPRWLQQIQQVDIIRGNKEVLSVSRQGDVVKEVPHDRADALELARFVPHPPPPPPGQVGPEDKQYRSSFMTNQTVNKAGRWAYFVADESPKIKKKALLCSLSLDIEGQTVIPQTTLAGLDESIGPEAGSWGVAGAADLVPGEYSLSIASMCVQGDPEMLRVWVKSPDDPAIRPLRSTEIKVKVVH